MSDDTRALRDALEDTQAALREAKRRLEALEAELAEARAPSSDAEALRRRLEAAERDRRDVEALRNLLEAADRRAAEAREAYEARLQALGAELRRLRATAPGAEASPAPRGRSSAPRPPPAPGGAAPSAKSVRPKGPPTPPRVIFGGAATAGGGAVPLGPDGRLVPPATPPAAASLAQPAGCLPLALLLALSVLVACAR